MLDIKKGRGAGTPRPVLDKAINTAGDSAPQPCDIRSPVERAWHRYRVLVLQAAQDPRLLKDTWHRRSMNQAHSTWSRLYVEGVI